MEAQNMRCNYLNALPSSGKISGISGMCCLLLRGGGRRGCGKS
jgi:hypothetical protein